MAESPSEADQMTPEKLQLVRLHIWDKPTQNSEEDLTKGLRLRMWPCVSSKPDTVPLQEAPFQTCSVLSAPAVQEFWVSFFGLVVMTFLSRKELQVKSKGDFYDLRKTDFKNKHTNKDLG